MSWEEFVTIYRPFLHNVVRRWGIDEHEACDIVQDVFVTLLGALPRFRYCRQRGRFRGWLKTIVHHITADRHRRRKRCREAALNWEQAADDFPAEAHDREAADHRQIFDTAVQHVQSTSVPATWQCFEEEYIRQRTAAEVSAETGMTPAAIYMNASRIRDRIKAKCDEISARLADNPPPARACGGSAIGCHELPRRRRT